MSKHSKKNFGNGQDSFLRSLGEALKSGNKNAVIGVIAVVAIIVIGWKGN